MKSLPLLFLLSILAASSNGCYKTKVHAGGGQGGGIAGPERRDRQWFTAAGLVGLSDPAGSECRGGVASSHSSMAGMDIAISFAASLAGAVVGSLVCDDEADAAAYASCVSVASSTGNLLIGSRTVDYRCAGGAAARLELVPGAASELGADEIAAVVEAAKL